MSYKIDLMIEPNIKFYNHNEIEQVFDNFTKQSKVKFTISKFTTKCFFRTEISYEYNISVNLRKDFCDWVKSHDKSFKFEIMNSKLLIVKAHIISDSDEIVISDVRNLTYEQAKKEILEYIDKVGINNMYISKIAEELKIDIDLIIDVLYEIYEE